MTQMRVIGFDPSLRNWGIASGWYNVANNSLSINHVGVIQTEVSKEKQVRQNSKDLETAAKLYQHALAFAKDAQAVFVEVPIGSQSARAMASYGVCVGVLGSLRASGIPFFEVTPTEVKLAAVGTKNASKVDMIDWAVRTFPDAGWPSRSVNGETKVIEGKAEHMADAIGAVVAGIQLQAFQQLASFARSRPA